MKLSLLFRLLFFWLLVPLSFIYGAVSYLNRILPRTRYKAKHPVISVGNILSGGVGKTPFCIELSNALLDLGFKPVVISKSYKASAEAPVEVLLSSDASHCGDEALLYKKKLPQVRVFSGPHKGQTVSYADKVLNEKSKFMYVLDDGAQHHSLKKDFKFLIWDRTREFWELFPFPFGFSREFFFLSEDTDLNFLNRSNLGTSSWHKWVCPDSKKITFEVLQIENLETKSLLEEDFILISGIGNFNQLKKSVENYISDKAYKMKSYIKAQDHDSFDWFDPKPEQNYVCTEKDFLKLKSKLKSDRLFVVKSGFSQENKDIIKRSLKEVLKL